MPTTATPLRERLLRRWYLVALGVLLTIGICGAGYKVIPPKYEAKANVLLVPPTAGSTAATDGDNVYTNLAGLQPLADVETRALLTSSVSDQLKQQGFQGDYTVERDQTTDAPILIVTATAKTPKLALADVNLVVAEASPTLAQLQAASSVAQKDQATAQVVTKPTKAPRSWKSLIRILVVVAVVCLVGTVLITAGIDEVLRRRKSKQAGDIDETESSEQPLAAESEPEAEATDQVDEPAPAVVEPTESDLPEAKPAYAFSEPEQPEHFEHLDQPERLEPDYPDSERIEPGYPEAERIEPEVESSASVLQLHSYGAGAPRWERSLFVASDDDRV